MHEAPAHATEHRTRRHEALGALLEDLAAE